MSQVKTIGVVGTGVIGASWTALFLAHGYKVLVADPGPGSEEKLAAYLKETWPVLKQLGLTEECVQTLNETHSESDSSRGAGC